MHRTPADKRRAVEMLLRDEEWQRKGDDWIAEQCHVTDKTVTKLRRELVAGSEIPKLDNLEGRDGKLYPTERRASAPRESAPPAPRCSGCGLVHCQRALTNSSGGVTTRLVSGSNRGKGRKMSSPHDWVEEAVAGLPALVTTEEVVKLLRTSRRQFYRIVSSGRLRTIKQSESGSAKHLVPRVELVRYLRNLEGHAA